MNNLEKMLKKGTLEHFIQRENEKDEDFLENLSGENPYNAQKKLYEFSGIFAIRLKNVMTEREYKQKDLVKKTGISKSTISKYLRGKEIPSAKNLDKIAEVFGIPSPYFLGMTNCVSFGEYYSFNVEKVMGISESTAKSFWSIKYSIDDFTDFPFINGDDFETKEKISINKENLDAFNLFASDRNNFLNFIRYLKNYMQILEKIENSKDVNLKKAKEKELVELEENIIKNLKKSLTGIVRKNKNKEE